MILYVLIQTPAYMYSDRVYRIYRFENNRPVERTPRNNTIRAVLKEIKRERIPPIGTFSVLTLSEIGNVYNVILQSEEPITEETLKQHPELFV